MSVEALHGDFIFDFLRVSEYEHERQCVRECKCERANLQFLDRAEFQSALFAGIFVFCGVHCPGRATP